MKTITILIIVTVAIGFAITLASGIYEQTLLPANLWSGTIQTWGGFPLGWWDYSQVGHVYFVNPSHWFSSLSFMSDVVFWFLISSASAFTILRLARMKKDKSIGLSG